MWKAGLPLEQTRWRTGAVGSVVLEKDQLLTTQVGKVEVLLTPGVFLRLGENSSVKMVSPDLANTRVELQKGRTLVEVIQIRKENDLRIDQIGASTRILKIGLYDFDADHAQVRVFKGSAEVISPPTRRSSLRRTVRPR
jgi:hypothetical protein